MMNQAPGAAVRSWLGRRPRAVLGPQDRHRIIADLYPAPGGTGHWWFRFSVMLTLSVVIAVLGTAGRPPASHRAPGEHPVLTVVHPSAAPIGPRPAASAGNGPSYVFRLDGEYWTLAFEGRVVTLRDSKDCTTSEHCWPTRGRERHVLDLCPDPRRGGARPEGSPPPHPPLRLHQHSTPPASAPGVLSGAENEGGGR